MKQDGTVTEQKTSIEPGLEDGAPVPRRVRPRSGAGPLPEAVREMRYAGGMLAVSLAAASLLVGRAAGAAWAGSWSDDWVGGAAMFTFLGPFALLQFAWAAFRGYGLPALQARLVASGRAAVGEVSDKKVKSRAKTKNGYRRVTTRYRVEYRYRPFGPAETFGARAGRRALSLLARPLGVVSVRNDGTVKVFAWVSRADHGRVREGAPATVLYDPRRPLWSVLYPIAPVQLERAEDDER